MSSLGGGCARYLSLTWDSASCDSEWFMWMSIVRVSVTVRPVLIAIPGTLYSQPSILNHLNNKPCAPRAACTMQKMIC